MDDIEKALGNFEDMYIDDKDDIKKKQKNARSVKNETTTSTYSKIKE